MRHMTLFLLTISIFAGCSDDKENKYSLDESAVTNTASGQSTNTGLDIGIGDIESNMRLYVLLDKTSYSPTIRHAEEFTKLEWIARASIDVASPYPDSLKLLIFSRNVKKYTNHAYRATINLYKEDEIVHSFKYVVGKKALIPKEYIVDIMPYIEPEPGKSILLHVRAELEFFPNTSEESITLDSPAPDTVTRATKMGNPLRLTFAP